MSDLKVSTQSQPVQLPVQQPDTQPLARTPSGPVLVQPSEIQAEARDLIARAQRGPEGPPRLDPLQEVGQFNARVDQVPPAQLRVNLDELGVQGQGFLSRLFSKASTVLENKAEALDAQVAAIRQKAGGHVAQYQDQINELEQKARSCRAEAKLEKLDTQLSKKTKTWGTADLDTRGKRLGHFLLGITGLSSVAGFFAGMVDGIRNRSLKTFITQPFKNLFTGLANIAAPFTGFGFGVTSNRDRTDQFMEKLAKDKDNPRNPPQLSEDEIQAYKELSKTDEGKAILASRGLLNSDQVQQMRGQLNLKQINELPPLQQLQIESLSTQEIQELRTHNTWDGVKQFAQQKGWNLNRAVLTHMTAEAHYDKEQKMWAQTLENPGGPAADKKKVMLQKVFHLMREGGLQFRNKAPSDSNPDGTAWQAWDKPLASALSHGGRVMLVVPEGQQPEDVFNWLTGGEQDRSDMGMHARTAATHGASLTRREDGQSHQIKEQKGFGPYALGFQGHQHFGMNLAVGGDGQLDINGERISAEGSHGHFYIGYKAPSEGKPGVIMIGLEGSDAFKTSMYGAMHNARGRSDPFSPTMSKKWRDVNDDPHGGSPDSYGGMVVNLQSRATHIMQGFQPVNDNLAQVTGPVPPDQRRPVSNPELRDRQAIDSENQLIAQRQEEARQQMEILTQQLQLAGML